MYTATTTRGEHGQHHGGCDDHDHSCRRCGAAPRGAATAPAGHAAAEGSAAPPEPHAPGELSFCPGSLDGPVTLGLVATGGVLDGTQLVTDGGVHYGLLGCLMGGIPMTRQGRGCSAMPGAQSQFRGRRLEDEVRAADDWAAHAGPVKFSNYKAEHRLRLPGTERRTGQPTGPTPMAHRAARKGSNGGRASCPHRAGRVRRACQIHPLRRPWAAGCRCGR